MSKRDREENFFSMSLNNKAPNAEIIEHYPKSRHG
jgi:hypothetical protein